MVLKELQSIEGDYTNLAFIDTTIKNREFAHYPKSLWSIITKKDLDNSSFSWVLDHKDSYVRLKSIDHKKVLAQLYVDTTLIEEKVLKGRIKNGYYSVKRKVRYFGLPIIFLTYSDYKIQLGKTDKDELVVDGVHSRYGWILIISAGTTDHFHQSYKKR